MYLGQNFSSFYISIHLEELGLFTKKISIHINHLLVIYSQAWNAGIYTYPFLYIPIRAGIYILWHNKNISYPRWKFFLNFFRLNKNKKSIFFSYVW